MEFFDMEKRPLPNLYSSLIAALREREEIEAEMRLRLPPIYLMIDQYNTAHTTHVLETMTKEGLSWCTSCKKITPLAELHLMFVEGCSEYSCGYGGGDIGLERFRNLRRICTKCRESLRNKHGWHGKARSDMRGSFYQEYFYAFDVEERADGPYVSRFGVWEKLGGEFKPIPNTMPKETEAEALRRFNLSPKIEVEEKHGEYSIRNKG